MQVKFDKKDKAKPIKPVRQTVGYMQLVAELKREKAHNLEMVQFGATAPQWLGGYRHSKHGVYDFVDLKPEQLDIREKDSDEHVTKLIQRVVVINSHNSVKIVTRIIGEPGLHSVKIGKGCAVQIDDEIRDHIDEYFKLLDQSNKLLEMNTGFKIEHKKREIK